MVKPPHNPILTRTCTIFHFHLTLHPSNGCARIVLFLVITTWKPSTTPLGPLRCAKLGVGVFPKRFKSDLQSRARVWDLELLKDRGMQNPDTTDFKIGTRIYCGLDDLLDRSETERLLRLFAVEDCCRTTREIRGICSGERKSVVMTIAREEVPTIFLLEVVSALSLRIRRAYPLHLQCFHHFIQ